MQRIYMVAFFLVYAMLVAVPVTAQQQSSDDKMKERIAEYMKYSMPGEHHTHLKPLVGKWQLAGKVRVAPEAPWQEFHSESQAEWILGGRFIMEKIKGEPSQWMPQPFEGLRILGYDNYKKKYVSQWMDNFATAVFISEGQCGEETQ